MAKAESASAEQPQADPVKASLVPLLAAYNAFHASNELPALNASVDLDHAWRRHNVHSLRPYFEMNRDTEYAERFMRLASAPVDRLRQWENWAGRFYRRALRDYGHDNPGAQYERELSWWERVQALGDGDDELASLQAEYEEIMDAFQEAITYLGNLIRSIRGIREDRDSRQPRRGAPLQPNRLSGQVRSILDDAPRPLTRLGIVRRLEARRFKFTSQQLTRALSKLATDERWKRIYERLDSWEGEEGPLYVRRRW